MEQNKVNLTFKQYISLIDKSDGLCVIVDGVRNYIHSEVIINILADKYSDFIVDWIGCDSSLPAVSISSQKTIEKVLDNIFPNREHNLESPSESHYNESVFLPEND